MKLSKHKWGKESDSSDLSPKKHKRVYKKMKSAERQLSKKLADLGIEEELD